MGGYDVFDRDRDAYTDEQIVFLEEDIGMQLKTTNDLEEEESWQDKDYDELDTLLVSQLKEICKTYNHPVTGKRKHELIEMIMGGRREDNLHPTEMEKVLKKALLSPLRDKDRSAWKLGLLNEAKVVSVIKAVVKGVGYELVHCWSVGLLRNKDNPFAATSLVIVSFIHGRRKQSATL